MKSAFLAVLIFSATSAQANFAPAQAQRADKTKKNNYVADAIVSGGDPLANPLTLSGVRWAPNQGFERVVIDLSGDGSGWESKQPPYFQVGVSPDRKILLNIRGISRRSLTQDALANGLSRSQLISKAYLAPALEGDLATIELTAQKKVEVETFYLVNPPRIILDVRAKK